MGQAAVNSLRYFGVDTSKITRGGYEVEKLARGVPRAEFGGRFIKEGDKVSPNYEMYSNLKEPPFFLQSNLRRKEKTISKNWNWHDELEIQFCTQGEGIVMLDGKRYPFLKNDIIVANPNVIHFTNALGSLTYSCLIINTEAYKPMGINCSGFLFSPHIKSKKMLSLLCELERIYHSNMKYRIALSNVEIIKILVELQHNHTESHSSVYSDDKVNSVFKATVNYIKRNYDKKITLDKIEKNVGVDKYSLCKDFKKFSGKSIMEYLNQFRCEMAAMYISEGYTAVQAANICGFNNYSVFLKFFKRYMGKFPSDLKREKKKQF